QDMRQRALSRYRASAYLRRFDHKWNTVIEAYRRWQAAPGRTAASPPPPRPLAPPPRRPPPKPEASSPAHHDTHGAPMDFRGMRHEPTNRDEVLFLFSKVHQELGIIVEHLRTGGYPDCEAKRRDPKTQRYTKCNIEFEWHSAGFQPHVSRQERCDLVVC